MARPRPGEFEPPDVLERPKRPPIADPVFPPKRPPVITPFPLPLPVPPAPTDAVPAPTVVIQPAAPDLQIMLSAIPIAQDDHVITGEFHNALRLALVAIANRFGLRLAEEELTITSAPQLSPAGVAPWAHEYGVVKKPTTLPGAVRGWMELDLPDGARIKKMVVFGTTNGVGTLKAKLKRQKVTDPAGIVDLIVIDIPDGADPTKGIDGDVTVPAAAGGAVAIEELRVVNNREHKYLLAVELDNPNSDTTAQFRSVQVVCAQ
jgi:hypothetical protein